MEITVIILFLLIGITIGFIIGTLREMKNTKASEEYNRSMIIELQEERIELLEELAKYHQ
jgi:large-conductance mechanosensitive channel